MRESERVNSDRFNPIVVILIFLSLLAPSCQGKTATHTTITTTSNLTPTATSVTTTLDGALSVHFIDVGQGDSILIDFGPIEVLIDGGDRSSNLIQELAGHIEGDLEVMIATHPHSDHIGGLIGVLDAFKVDEVWTNGETYDSTTYREFSSKASAEGASLKVAKRGDTIIAGTLNLSVLGPDSLGMGDTNENSIVVRLVFGNISFLFTGDAGISSETSMITADLLLKSNILKVGHHGSYSASSVGFLNVVKPEIAVYMAGLNNNYGHPHQVTIEKLQTIRAIIYGTSVNGSIIISTDGIATTVQLTKVG